MIRILHTSDWHLGKRLERFSRHGEQVEILEEIRCIADEHKADVIVIAGDLFDTFNPPAESLDLFYSSLKKLASDGKRPIIAIAGNHDMPERIEAPDPLARECGIIFAGFPDTSIPEYSMEGKFKIAASEPGFMNLQLPGKPALRVLSTPYANEIRLRKGLNQEKDLQDLLADHWRLLADRHCDDKGVNILMTHLLFMNEGDEVPEEPEDERPINHIGGAQAIYTSAIPASLQYVALGHLHRTQTITTVPCPVIYSGSPLSYSFSEAGQQKHVLLIDLEPGKAAHVALIPLKGGRPLFRKRSENLQEAEGWLLANPDALVELTLVSDTYLSGENRRKLQELHGGIIAIIPEIRNSVENAEPADARSNHVQAGIQELFCEFFSARKGQVPDDGLLEVLKEVIAETEQAE
jgi:exonuclease SbcD